jgi:hypothetical protein
MNEQTKQITFDIPEGYDIDIEHSDLKTRVIKLKPINKQLPRTWEEYCGMFPATGKEYYLDSSCELNRRVPGPRCISSDRNLGTKETCEAVLVLMQLIQLRDCYNDGWKPDCSDGKDKFVIYCETGEIIADINTCYQRVLAFKTEELCNQFLENFSELIEKAKPLI